MARSKAFPTSSRGVGEPRRFGREAARRLRGARRRPTTAPSRRWRTPARRSTACSSIPKSRTPSSGSASCENFVRRVCRCELGLEAFVCGNHRSHQGRYPRARRPDEERAVLRQRRRRFVCRVQAVRRRARAGSRARRVCRHRLHAEERIRRRDGGVREGRLQERAPARCVGGVSRRRRQRDESRDQATSESASRFSRSRTTCSSICRRANGCSARARSIPTRSSRAARANRRSSRRITTACPSCCGASRPARSSSRSCSSIKMRCARSGGRSACRRASSRSSRFPVRVSPCGSSAPTSRRRGRRIAKLSEVASGFNLKARVLPVRGVGVQGDERTYAHTALLTGDYDERRIAELSPAITNSLRDVNRVVFWAGAKGSIDEFQRRADHDIARRARRAARSRRARARHPCRVRHAEAHLAVPGRHAPAEAARASRRSRSGPSNRTTA